MKRSFVVSTLVVAAAILLGSLLVPSFSSYTKTFDVININVNDGEKSFVEKGNDFASKILERAHSTDSYIYQYFAGYTLHVKTGKTTPKPAKFMKKAGESLDSEGFSWAPYVEQELVAIAKNDPDFSWYNGISSWRIYLAETDKIDPINNVYNIFFTTVNIGLWDINNPPASLTIDPVYRYSMYQTPAISIGTSKALLKNVEKKDTYIISGADFVVTDVILDSLS